MAKKQKLPTKDINFYTIVAGPTTATKAQNNAIWFIIGAGVLVVMIGVFAGVKIYSASIENDLEDAQAELDDPETQEKLSQMSQLQSEVNIMQKAADAYEETRDIIDSAEWYTENITDEFITQLLSCQEGTSYGAPIQVAMITNIEYSDSESNDETIGVLEISAQSSNSRYASFFSENLIDLGIFDDVTYSGYSYDSSDDVYEYTIECTFAAYVSEEDEATAVTSTDEETEEETTEEEEAEEE